MQSGSAVKVGAIGFRNHAAKVIRIVEESGVAAVSRVYHPDRLVDHPGATQRIEDLLGCDAVMILSPNTTHFEYLDFFQKNYTGYIFCEKPPVTASADLERLALNPSNAYFNFNFRFSELYEKMQSLLSQDSMGKPVSYHVSTTHGLAFTDRYKGTWRAQAEKPGNGVAETKSVHFIDMALGLFGDAGIACMVETNFSGGGAADTSYITLRHANGVTGSILASYAAPYTNHFQVIGTDGILEHRPDALSFYGPRDSFTPEGRFAPPAKQWSVPYPHDEGIGKDSLRRSVLYFLDIVQRKQTFPHELFHQSISTTRLVLSLEDRKGKDRGDAAHSR